MRRIVALGSGIAGWYALRTLSDQLQGRPHLELTILCEHNHLSYGPLLPGVASGQLEPADAALPFSRAVDDERRIVDAIERIDPTSREVIGEDAEYPFDALLLDAGLRTDCSVIHPDRAGGAHGVHTLGTVAGAVRIRDALRERLSRRDSTSTTVAIVGGGATGAQLAGHLASAAVDGEIEVVLFESEGRLISDHPPEMQVAAEQRLEEMDVTVRTNTHVQSAASGTVTLADESSETFDTLVWCGPKRGRTYGIGNDAPAVRDGFIAIDEAHRVRGMAAAFGCGASTRGATGREPSPRREKKQGTVAAKNLVASLSGQSLTQLEEKSAVLDGLLWLGSSHLAHRGGTLLEGWAAKTIFAGYHASVLPGAMSKARLASQWLTEPKSLLSAEPEN